MRPSKNFIILTGIAIFIVALVFQTFGYFQRTDELEKTNAELAQTQARSSVLQVDRLSEQESEAAAELARVNLQLSKVKSIFAEPFTSVNATKLLLDMADKVNLDVTAVSSSAPFLETIDEITYSAVSLTANITGDLTDIINLVSGINESLPTGIVKSINVNIPQTPSANATSAIINLVAYTHREDS